MTDRDPTYCQAPGCDRPTKEGRKYCERDYKRAQRGQPVGGESAAQLSPMERVISTGTKYLETDPEDDVAYAANERAFLSAARALGIKAPGDAIRAGMERARAAGVRLGRPPKLEGQRQLVRELVERLGQTGAAEVLGVTRATVRHTLKRATKSHYRPRAAAGSRSKMSDSEPMLSR